MRATWCSFGVVACAAALAQEAPRADLSHIAAGQRFVYEMNASGMEMRQVYEVVGVGDRWVDCRIHMEMKMPGATEMTPQGEPSPFRWEIPLAANQDPALPPGAVATRRETIVVCDVEWDCLVSESHGTKVWVPMKGDLPTFPPYLKMESAQVKAELVKAEGMLPLWRMGPAELMAAAWVQAIGEAQEALRWENGQPASKLSELAELDLIPADVAAGQAGGYAFALEGDARGWSVTARPSAEGSKERTWQRRSGSRKLRCAVGREPVEGDLVAEVWTGELPALPPLPPRERLGGARWATIPLRVEPGETVFVAAEGKWRVGATWAPSGPEGTAEPSSLGELRADETAPLGCLLARVQGRAAAMKEAGQVLRIPATEGGQLELAMNRAGDQLTQRGSLRVWALVLRSGR